MTERSKILVEYHGSSKQIYKIRINISVDVYLYAYIFTSSYRCYELDGVRFTRNVHENVRTRQIFIEIMYAYVFLIKEKTYSTS